MGKDKKRMKKVRIKRTASIKKQIGKHKDKIENEEGRFDTTKGYWQKEIEEKFLKQLDEDNEFLEDK